MTGNNNKTDVIIVGAGPTGLMAACQLRRFGVECIIIDKKSGPTVESRALGVQSRTLEIYEQMDIAAQAVDDGQILKWTNLIVEGKIRQRVPFGDMGKGLSPYPYMLIYEQYKNEKLLYEYLRSKEGEIWWNSELEDLNQNEKEVKAQVKRGDEHLTVTASYLIGADGAKSIVRHKLDFSFTGGTYENIFFVADTEVDWEYGYEQLFICISKNTFTGMFGMKGHHRFRLIGIMPKNFKDEHSLTLDDIEQEVVSKMGIKVDFKNTSWFSVYRLHHRCVDNFSKGRIFLAGDAAHVHSPAGGQGMNTGLQDVYNLAWKMAYVIKGFAEKKFLHTYNEERLPFAKRLVRTTDRGFAFVSTTNPFLSFLRVRIIPLVAGILMRINFFRRLMYMTISQTRIEYRSSGISANGGNDFSGGAPRAGDRVPYVFLYHNGGKISIYDLLHKPCFHLLVFGDDIIDIKDLDPEIVKAVYIRDKNKNSEIYKTFGIKTKGVFLVRPDNYIGMRSSNISSAEIKDYFTSRLHFIKM